jgi:hypothetical protein
MAVMSRALRSNSPLFTGNTRIRTIFFYPPGPRICFLFLPDISLTIKISKFKLYIIPAKYIPIWTAFIDSLDLEVLIDNYRKITYVNR